MPNIQILKKEYVQITRERDEDDEWDQDDTYTETDILGVCESNDYFDISVPFNLHHDQTYFLVIISYSTGDSFHREEGIIEYVDLYETKEKAKQCLNTLEAQSNNKHIPLIRENGMTYRFTPPWLGYFESLESMRIVEVKKVDN